MSGRTEIVKMVPTLRGWDSVNYEKIQQYERELRKAKIQYRTSEKRGKRCIPLGASIPYIAVLFEWD